MRWIFSMALAFSPVRAVHVHCGRGHRRRRGDGFVRLVSDNFSNASSRDERQASECDLVFACGFQVNFLRQRKDWVERPASSAGKVVVNILQR